MSHLKMVRPSLNIRIWGFSFGRSMGFLANIPEPMSETDSSSYLELKTME